MKFLAALPILAFGSLVTASPTPTLPHTTLTSRGLVDVCATVDVSLGALLNINTPEKRLLGALLSTNNRVGVAAGLANVPVLGAVVKVAGDLGAGVGGAVDGVVHDVINTADGLTGGAVGNVVDTVDGLTAALGLKLDLCLCVSVLPGFVSGHSILGSLGHGQQTDIIAALTSLINANAANRCSYPPFAIPYAQTCGNFNCGFDCPANLIHNPATRTCDCPAEKPYLLSSGVCSSAPPSQSSKRAGAALKRKERLTLRDTCNKKGYALCPVSERLGVSSTADQEDGLECVETASSLESCGGCSTSFGLASAPQGRDCTSIAGADEVSCSNSRCLISSCQRGWTISSDGESCLRA